MKSLEEVLNRMDEIVVECRNENNVHGYFAVLYRMVTRRIKEGIDRGEFEDNNRMENLDILFAKRYFDALELNKKGEVPSLSWLTAFRAAEENRLLIMHHLLLGINAHINLDLGIAAVETMNGKPLKGLKNDFDKINNILASMVEGVKNNLSRVSKIFGIAIRLANKKDEMLVNFSIQVARKGAWDFALRYEASTDRSLSLHLRDESVDGIAQRLASPGWHMRRIIGLIRLGEYHSVPKVMELLENIHPLPGIITGELDLRT